VSYPRQEFRKTPPEPLTPEQLARRMAEAFPESAGPGTDTEGGTVLYGQPGHPRVGPVPHLLDPELRDKENREREARQAAIPEAVRQAKELIEAEMRAERRRF